MIDKQTSAYDLPIFQISLLTVNAPLLLLDYLPEVVVEISNCTLFYRQAGPTFRTHETGFVGSRNSLGTPLQNPHFLIEDFYLAAYGNVEMGSPGNKKGCIHEFLFNIIEKYQIVFHFNFTMLKA